MATNVFKRVTRANVSNSAGSPTSLYTVPTSQSSILIGCLLTNKNTGSITGNIKINTAIVGEDDVMIVSDISIPGKSSIELVMGKIVVTNDGTNGDVIEAWSNTASAMDITLSVLEDVN